ncbi:AbgT family transporter [Microaceticoccus formicicus]|uniref:AbgT family transporter n=1 Tax=Microaceticoccus formicicus TaxID=3118105 RepID=UPI003CD04086|nr:AbgT family transporter [Peptoniphilaceae bacterium AMB_02]
MSNDKSQPKKSRSNSILNGIEKAGNALPDPALLFIILALITMIVSYFAAQANMSVTYDGVNNKTGNIEPITVHVYNLLSLEGFHYMVTSVISNFSGFFPLGTVFTVVLGVSICEGTGMLSALLRRAVSKTPPALISAMVVFLGIMSNIASSTGYVVLVPLGAVIFMASRRHPIAGLAAAYAGVSGGWTANLLLGSNDPLYAGMSTQAAQMLNPNYIVQPTGNWFFMIVSTFMITLIGTLITDKVIEPRLPEYKFTEEEHSVEITQTEKKGMKFAGIAALIYIVIMAVLIVPKSGLLRNPETGKILSSPFMSGIVFFMMLFFMIPGIAYGFGSGKIKNSKDITKLMSNGIAGISSFLVLIFFAAQFTAFFNKSNLGTILSVNGANLLKDIGLLGLPLLVIFVLLTCVLNIFIPVDTAKWAMMAPIFVPMFMQLGLTPEMTQLAFRIGDSSTNIITPLMPFFVMIVAYFQKYDSESGIGSVVSTMLPYSFVFLISWIILLVIWYLVGLPLGPGAFIKYVI